MQDYMQYEMKWRVQYYETDRMGIVHHSNYIRYFETARTEFIRKEGLPYETIEEMGVLIPVLAVSAEYKTPRDPCLPWRGKLGPGHTLR